MKRGRMPSILRSLKGVPPSFRALYQRFGLRARLSRTSITFLFISLGGSLLLTFLLIDYISVPVKEYRVGDVAERDIKAIKDFNVVDQETTRKKRRMAEESILPVFDYSNAVQDKITKKVGEAFSSMREYTYRLKKGAAMEGGGDELPDAEEAKNRFLDKLNIDLPRIFYENLVMNGFGVEIENDLYELLKLAYSFYIIQAKEGFQQDLKRGITIIDLDDSRGERVLRDTEKIKDVKEIENIVSEYAFEKIKRKPYLIDTEVALLRGLIEPNLTYNARETGERRKQAAQSMGSVTVYIKKGRVIVRKGDPITKEHIALLTVIKEAKSQFPYWKVFIVLFILTTALNYGVFKFSALYIRKFPAIPKTAVTLTIILCLILGIARLFVEIGTGIAGTDPSSDIPDYRYLIPVAAGAMLVRLLLNSETALIFAIVCSFLTGFIIDNSLMMMLYFFMGSITAAGGIGHTRERVKIFNAGLFTAGVNILMIALISGVDLYLAGGETGGGGMKFFYNFLFGAGGGILTSVVVLGMIPLFEIFGYVTDSKLLELANFNNPLLRELMFHAPGSYHHSLILGAMTEAAAEEIGSNALLCRVASYYHDIGKIKKPMYFIENTGGEDSKHDRLTPSMSTLIITSHVRDGVEMATQYGLPAFIQDVIQQHHGTRLVRYFYSIAKGSEEERNQKINEADFRYRGPKPATREAGIILLGDAVEAATRALKNPTPARIENRINEVVKEIMDDDQLADCPLTLKDISIIKRIFRTMLVGIFHNRIEYPDIKVIKQPGKTVSVSKKGIITHEWSVTPTPQEGALKVQGGEDGGKNAE